MASNVFLDSNGWVALLHANDALHSRADAAMRAIGGDRRKLVLTDYIIAETGNALSRRHGRSRFVDAVKQLRRSDNAEIVFVDPPLLDEAIALYQQSADKSWGLVDCTSFILMRQLGVSDAFTSDRHFEQAGFHCLLA